MPKTEMITQERLIELFSYNADTGEFLWRKKWRGCRKNLSAGSRNKKGYISIGIKGIVYYAHRLAWLYVTGNFPVDMIDHINGNRSDNRFDNLRECTMSQNGANSGKRPCNTSGYKGVCWRREKEKFDARCTIKGKTNWLGYFDTAEKASAAYENFASAALGEFYNNGRIR